MTIWQTITNVLGLGDAPHVEPTSSFAFTAAMIALSAKMAKSDGRVTDEEVEAFRRVCTFPESETEHVRRVFDLAKQDVAGYDVYARRLGRLLANEPELRLHVIEGLFVIAAADGILHEREDVYLADVARIMGVSESEFAWVRSMFVETSADPYAVLGLTPAATDAELKARHRALVLEHHPDRLIGRGVPPEFVALGEKKLAAINAAYDRIAAERRL
ncbi:MAG: molecular chaperone DjiA [Proteobacteria bacterium]|nr:molecular chaperone DjiA [Pseudomonadota bacterium]